MYFRLCCCVFLILRMVTRYYGIYVVYMITVMYRKHNQHLSFCYSLFNIALMNKIAAALEPTVAHSFIHLLT